ncbi:MAG: type II secretion system protein [Candidatus Saccharimonadales bacterium]
MRRVGQKRGDTLIEVMFSITIFALIAVITVNLMNGGVYTAQKSLEVTMARNEIDAQAEALRFIQNSYLSEKAATSGSKQFSSLWKKLTDSDQKIAQMPNVSSAEDFNINNLNSCADAYGASGQVLKYNSFVLNTRLIQPEYSSQVDGAGMSYSELLDKMVVGAKNNAGKLNEANLYPRVLFSAWRNSGDTNDASLLETSDYREIASAEGVWVVSVRGGTDADKADLEPEYYDFYVRTCWHSIGRSAPSTIGSIIRLYNPEVVD